MEIPKETDLPERQGYPQPYPGQYGSLNPMQGMQGTQNQNQTMQGMQGILNVQQKYQTQSDQTQQQPPFAPFSAAPPPSLTTTNMANITGVEAQSNNLNVSLGPSHGVAIMNLSALRSAMVSPRARQVGNNEMSSSTCTGTSTTATTTTATTAATSTTLTKRHSEENDDNENQNDKNTGPGEWWPYPSETGPGVEIETIRSRMLRTVHWSGSSPPENGRSSNNDSDSKSRETSRVMNMVNRPLTPSLMLLWEEKLKGTE
jgi:hypothetical protein